MGRSAHDAVEAARGYVLAGKDWVVDLDISAFFDEVDHDILLAAIGRKVRDKRVLKLIGRYLRAGNGRIAAAGASLDKLKTTSCDSGMPKSA